MWNWRLVLHSALQGFGAASAQRRSQFFHEKLEVWKGLQAAHLRRTGLQDTVVANSMLPAQLQGSAAYLVYCAA